MIHRVTSERIEDLFSNEIFVFASNEAGRHNTENSKKALRFGAMLGRSAGMTGKTYAIPTNDFLQKKLPLFDIKLYVELFTRHARIRTDLVFLVTRIGCGVEGFQPEEIAPMFLDASKLENVRLPQVFWDIFESEERRKR